MGIAELSNTEPHCVAAGTRSPARPTSGQRPIASCCSGRRGCCCERAGSCAPFSTAAAPRCAVVTRHVQGDVLACAYHGWRFGPDGRCVGIRPSGPMPPSLRVPASRRHTGSPNATAWSSSPRSRPSCRCPRSPRRATPLHAGDVPAVRARASVGLLADNFLDMAHFPFVHRATFGADEAAEVPAYRLDRDGWAFTVSYEHSFSNREDPAVAEGTRPLLQHRRLTYRYDAPFQPRAAHRVPRGRGLECDRLLPPAETADSCRLYTTLWRDDLDGDTGRMAEAVAFEKAVLDEDLAIQTAFDRLVLPLERTTELHTRQTAARSSCAVCWPSWWRPPRPVERRVSAHRELPAGAGTGQRGTIPMIGHHGQRPLQRMTRRIGNAEPRWPASLALLVAIVLYVSLPAR